MHPHDALLRAARQDWARTAELRDTYRQHRPMVERSIAWLIGPKGRCRQLRYPHRADLDTHVSRLTAQPTGRC